jgi:predicted anti-sigma-YlaC factor YlaD
MKIKRPSCDDYLRMPITERVIDHIRSCEDCRAIFNALADDLDRRANEFEGRN